MKRKLFAILMALTLVLTYMPAIAFAGDGDEPEDRGNPVSLKFIHDGDYEVEGSYSQDGDIDEETGEWEATSDPYIYYYVPSFVEGDIVNVTYENGQIVSYVNTTVHDEIMDCDFTNFRSNDDTNDMIYPLMNWAREQSYSNQFEAGTSEELKITLMGNEDETLFDTVSASLVYNEEPEYPDEPDEKGWWLDYDSETVIFENGKADLAVEVEEDYGTPAGTYTYKWFKWSDTAGEDGDYVAISGATKNTYTATELGDYCCIVTRDNGETSSAEFCVKNWAAKEAGDIMLVQGGTEVLKVELIGNVPSNLRYKWLKGDDEFEGTILGDGSSIKIDSAGEYYCEIYEGDNEEPSEYVEFCVVQLDREWDISQETDEVEIPVGKKVKLEISVKGKTEGLKYQWVQVSDGEGDSVSYTNIPGATGTSYETSETGSYRCYAYTHDGPVDFDEDNGDVYLSFWVDNETVLVNGIAYRYCDGTAMARDWDELEGTLNIASSAKFSDGKTYPVTGIEDFSYNKITSVNIPASVRFIEGGAFASTSLTSVTIPATVEDIGEHAFGYNYVPGSDETEFSKVSGFIIYGKTGTAAERYAKANSFKFVDKDAEAAAAKAKADAEAKAKVAAAKAKADAEAKAKAEAARQGVYDSSIPKVKASKPTTKKATVTAKWKKLNKKQLKKSKATHYEVWICENTGFAKEQTKEKIVKKGKASVKITGLKKNTKYYVKVRAIKYVGGVKHVGKWSQKTIKTKKK